eukprot:CAMPEP_0198154576 /NCGR_PEP_ID=MMETSP1443-20131203/68664_1 /TAXON_ID=186043 /ORGANISM="Entomoneis sp., Strain CCMP2396" /LENGTH=203 /DNA_ID=CAMNT_0043821257 /DNA_START=1142 /DNA_END=1753 /DNA_ORIENTATION=-
MTIKLEQETILRVLERPPQLRQRLLHDDSLSTVSSSSSIQVEGLSCIDFRKPLSSVERVPDFTGDDDDTLSTASMSSDEETIDRRVSFCKDVVTDVWTRPFTEKEDLSYLFYSPEDTARFRQEYRLEKKLLSELSIDPDTCSVDEKDLSAMMTTGSAGHAYRISRVVVLHDNKLETFVDHTKDSGIDGFFDNDSFWSGSITWY